MNSFDACGVFEQLKFFPKGRRALEDIMATIDEFLSEAQIETLVAKMKTFDEWPGPATLAAECRSIAGIRSPGSLPEYHSPAQPAIECRACVDRGYVHRLDVYVRCECQNGQEFPDELLRALNGRTVRARGARPLDQAARSAEFARILDRITSGLNSKPE